MRRRRGIMGLNGGAGIPVITATATGNPLTFETDMIKPLKSLVIPFTPIQAAGTPSPDNILPISGWTGCEIGHSGENLITNYLHANVNSSGKVESHDTYDIALAPVQSGQKYKITGETSDSASGVYAFFRTKPAVNSTSYNGSRTVYNIENTDIITAPITGWIAVRTMRNVHTVSIEKAELLTVSWQTEAGTVYGGTLTLNEDESVDLLTTYVSRKISQIGVTKSTGTTEPWTHRFAIRYYVSGKGYDFGSPFDWYFDRFPKGNADRNYTAWRSSGIIYVYDNEVSTAQEFVTKWGDVQLVYSVNGYSRKSYHFDNVGQLIAFLGTNTIWTDTNGTNTATYLKHQS